jgi:hypothetical protein
MVDSIIYINGFLFFIKPKNHLYIEERRVLTYFTKMKMSKNR